MATYAKILKDNADNQILPYTRSKLVYMDDGSTVEDAINNIQSQGGYTLPTASAYTLGGVKIGNNINISNGAISIGNSEVCNALGYTPTDDNTLNYTNTTASINKYIDGGYFLGNGLRIFRQGAVCYFFIDIITASDWIANTSIPFLQLDRRFMPNPLSCASYYDQKNYITRTGLLYFPMHWFNDSQQGEFYVISNNYFAGDAPKMILYAYPNATIPKGAHICGSCTYMTQNYPGDSTNKNTPVKTFSGDNPDIR